MLEIGLVPCTRRCRDRAERPCQRDASTLPQRSCPENPARSLYFLNLFLAAFRLFREDSSCLSRTTSRTSLFISLYMAFTKFNVAASNLFDEDLRLLDDLGMLSPSAAMDQFHQVFLLFPHCVLLHVPKQPVRPVLVVSLTPIHLLLTIGFRLSSEGRTNHPCGCNSAALRNPIPGAPRGD